MLIQTLKMKTQKGVGLIEVLVAVLILSIGVLGLVGLQTRSLQLSQESLLSSQALLMAYEMTDRMRANKDSANSYTTNYGDSVTQNNDCESNSCTPSQLANYELSQWKSTVAANLPEGDGKVERDTSGTRPFYIVSVRFRDNKVDKALSGGTGADTYREIAVQTEM